MATSLLRLGRLGSLKCLQQEGWGTRRTSLAVAFCTKTETPKKPAKKASTLEAPAERAALLAYKTTVAFPTRLSTPGCLSPGGALGEQELSGDPMTKDKTLTSSATSAEPTHAKPQVSAEDSSEDSDTTADVKQSESVTDDSVKTTESCDVGATAEDTSAAETATEKNATSPTSADEKELKSEVAPKDNDDGTSSSSSSSDSDSDSDSDDEKEDKSKMTESVIQSEDKAGQTDMPSAGSKEPTSDIKTGAVPEQVQSSGPKGAPEVTEAINEPTSKEVPSLSTAATPSEEIVDPAPVLGIDESVDTQAEVIVEKPSDVEAEVIVEKPSDVEAKSSEELIDIPEPVNEGAPNVAADPTPEVILDSAAEVAPKPEVEITAAPETTEAVAAEKLADPAPVITDAEEVRTDPEVAAAPEEAAPAPAPEPEPFDNTTYQNLQHHNYNIYTFVDMDVEMAKHRLPQPSTGRPSPRH